MALEQHQRPTAMLMRDPYIGHRDSFDNRPDGPANEWTAWDFAIATCMQIIEDGTTEQGHLVWEIDADDVDVQATRKINKAQAAIDRITNNEKYKSADGEYFVTEMIHPYVGQDDPEPHWQTREEWIAKQVSLSNDTIE